jgi:acetyltransferase-like isoleucine patch superfamily enzyme
MNLLTIFRIMRKKIVIWWCRQKGVKIAGNCNLNGIPDFGSEPYLITIDDNVSIAAQVSFITHDGGTAVFRSQERYKNVIKYGRIRIKNNSVIGIRAIILPGVTIGPNTIVAAGSVVTRNAPPNTLVAGNPAKPIMSVQQYADWSLASTPEYDVAAYKRNKRDFLEKFSLRGG